MCDLYVLFSVCIVSVNQYSQLKLKMNLMAYNLSRTFMSKAEMLLKWSLKLYSDWGIFSYVKEEAFAW